MRKLLLALGILLVGSNTFAAVQAASVGVTVTTFDAVDLTAPAGVYPTDYSLFIGTNGASALTWQTIYSAAPTSVTVLLQGSTDCSTFATVDTSTSTAGEIRTVFGSWRCVRINNSAANGAGKTLTVKFVYSTGRAMGSLGGNIYTGGTFTSPILLSDGTDAAPSLSFASNTGHGFRYASAGGFYFIVAGTKQGYFNTGGIQVTSNKSFSWATTGAGTTDDLLLSKDTSNALALRNGGTSGSPVPQTFNIYNFCDGTSCATGYERGVVRFSGNQFQIGTENAGTGTARTIAFLPGGTGKWFMHGTTFAFYPAGDGTQVIGGPTFRIQDIYVKNSVEGSSTKTLTEASATAFVNIAIPDGGHVGGKVLYDIYCADAVPNFVDRSCEANFACINKADTENCNVQTPVCSGDANSSGGSFSVNTLDYIAGTNSINLRETATCSLAQTVLEIHYRLDILDPQTVTPQ